MKHIIKQEYTKDLRDNVYWYLVIYDDETETLSVKEFEYNTNDDNNTVFRS